MNDESCSHCRPARNRPPRKRWAAFAARVARLALRQPERTADLVRQSYDSIASGYDEAWTNHMRTLSLAMLDRLDLPAGAACVDLGCGTGFVTAELSRRAGRRAVGVDNSAGMLAIARRTRGADCEFVCCDAVDYLRRRAHGSADVITCAWSLGYTRPLAVVRHAARVLRGGGWLGIIDNTLLSLAEVLRASVHAFAECPAALRHVMKVRFLPRSTMLAAAMRACGLRVVWSCDGSQTYTCRDGRSAIERLTATGAAAGFEFAAQDEHRERIFARFAEIIEDLYGTPDGVPITHRYLACVGQRP